MPFESILFNCPNCGAALEKSPTGRYRQCPKCDKIVKYAGNDYALDTVDMKGEVLVKVEDSTSIVLIPLKGKIRLLTGSSKRGVTLMFDTKGEDNGENRTGSSSDKGSGSDS